MSADLQRLAGGFLQPLSRPPYRAWLHPVWRHRRRGGRSAALCEGRPEGCRGFVLLGYGADVAPAVGAAVAGGQRSPVAVTLPYLPDHGTAVARVRYQRAA